MSPTTPVKGDRAVGVVVASAAADALGAPYEFGPQLPADTVITMSGGGSFSWDQGEWTDDTQQALAVLAPLAAGNADPLPAIEDGLVAWERSGPADVGVQTRAVFGRAGRDGAGLAAAAAAHTVDHPDAAGNCSLMRTGPVGLAHGGDLDAIAVLAADVSRLTHAHPDCIDACVLWSTAIARAIDLPVGDAPDWIELVAAGLDHIPADRRDRWRDLIDMCRTTPPEAFTSNGWVIEAFQAALAAIAQTDVPTDAAPCTHLRLTIERAVRVGNDTDTVAAIAGSLLGAFWGATAVPYEWRRPLHGYRVYRKPQFHLADLDRQARLAASAGDTDDQGWPGVDALLPHYLDGYAAGPTATELVDGVLVGGVHDLLDVLPSVDAVVSLCRMGTHDVPSTVEHHAIGLIDTTAAENPNLDFVLADTADLVAALVKEDKRVLLHCVRAENRTPTVAAAYLVRHHATTPDAALARAHELLGATPKPFLTEAVHRLG